MKTQGFTLIEVLVVVLIIGILTSIALPQYQFAVEKARAAEGLVSLRAIADAAEIYYSQYNTYPDTLDQLDISLPDFKYFDIEIYNKLYIGLIRKGAQYRLAHIYYENPNRWAPRDSCDLVIPGLPMDTKSIGAKICKNLCQTNTLEKIWGSTEPGCIIAQSN